jgi:hypothetical protein
MDMNTPSINPPKSKYNTGLSKRGSLTLLIPDELLKEWSSPVSGKQAAGEPGYPQGILQCCLSVRPDCRLPCRQSAEFLKSLFRLAGKESLPVPDYYDAVPPSKTLPVKTGRCLQRGENPVAGTDSTGLKVCGEGEWKVRRHGRSRRRTWRKLHVCVDLAAQEILTVTLTGNGEDDAAAGSRMLQGHAHGIKSFKGEGAYDRFGFREISGGDVQQVIPPLKNAAVRLPEKEASCPLIRFNAMRLRYIQLDGKTAVKPD